MLFKNANIFVGGQFQHGPFRVENGRFAEILTTVPAEDGIDLENQYVIPGLVDGHNHGNSGADFSDGDYDGLVKMARYLAQNGVTSFAPASMTLPYDVLEAAYKTAVQLKKAQPEGCARLMGIQMEGPFFSEKKKGAQNGAYLRDPDFAAFKRIYDVSEGLLRIADVAAELPGAVEFAEKASKLCTVSIAHSDCTYEEAAAVFDAGTSHLTHLYNAMPGIHHRKPGPIGAASERENVIAELICDGQHIHPSAVRMAFKLFPGRICLISDALRCCGMPDGQYTLGGQDVFLHGGVAKLADGTLAGSATNLYYWETESHQITLQAAIDAYNASQTAYKVTAKYVSFADFKKQLSIGAVAETLPDMVILDSPDHASYASMGIFGDITGKIDVSGYFEGPVNSCTYDGKLYGVPFGVNCLAMFYNKDMLAEAGLEVPTTWSELKDAAAKISDGSRYGFAFCSLQNEEGTFNFMPWVWSAKSDYATIGDENGVKALSFAKDLIDSGAMSKECINWTQGDDMNQFISGNVAMMVNGCWQIPTMRSEAADLNWGVSLIPMCDDGEYASVIGGENYAVIEGGNVDGALDFLNYMTNEDVVELMSGFGYIAGIESIAQNEFSGDEDYRSACGSAIMRL